MTRVSYDDAPDAESPQLMGILPFNCATCNASTIPLYELSCHDSDDFHCRDCLTKKWYYATDEIVRCPHSHCGRDCGFMLLAPFGQSLHLSHNFFDIERVDKIRQQPEIMNNLIGFTNEEAGVVLQHVYSLFEDQILDPSALGGMSGDVTQYAENSLQSNLNSNPFFAALISEVKAAPKMMTTPLELEEDLNNVLTRQIYRYAIEHYGSELARWGIDLTHQNTVLEAALANHKPIKDLNDCWHEIIQKFVDLLAWRHLERVAPPEGSAAERQ